MAYKNSLITGITDLLVLSILEKHDSYVYELTKNISNYSSGLLSISQNTVYTATYKLAEAGMITEYTKLVGKKRTRVYYHIEQGGKDQLKKLYEEYSKMNDGVQKIMDVLGG